MGIFFLGIPFPLLILAAAMIGFAGTRAGLPHFQTGEPKAREADRAPLLGRPCRPMPARSSGAPCALPHPGSAVARTGPVARPRPWTGSRVQPNCRLLLKDGHGDIRGAYAALAYVAQQAVDTYGWLEPSEMLDGLGMAETTPGPLIMVLQFVGFMAAFRDPGSLSPLMAGTIRAWWRPG